MKPAILDCSRISSLAVVFSLACGTWAAGTALDDYIALEDPSYAWTINSTVPIAGNMGTVFNIDMTSQTWRSESDVNRSVWQHRLNIVVPTNAVQEVALLIVEGGSNSSPPLDVGEYAYFASLVGCTVALLQTVPNQPLRFYNPTTGPLSEDNAIGHTYDKYLNAFVEGEAHPDPTWPLLLPMVKSAVRAMDTIQACLDEHTAVDVSRFVVAGASKRGWTTWLTAAVDDRVVGIMPLVIDILSMSRQLDHHKNAYSSYPATSSANFMYGGYSTAIRPYTERQIFERLSTPEGMDLQGVVDPYTYRDRLTMPKLIVNSTGDQFFLPDGIKFYFNQLPGENYIYYAPNTDHGLGFDLSDLSVLLGLLNFVKSFFPNGPAMPEYSWNFTKEGAIRVAPVDEPTAVWLWQAHTPTHRDFRLQTVGPLWQKSPLTTQDETGAYIAAVPAPETGWTGFYVQLDFANGMSLCSGLRVLPDDYANGAEPPDVFGPEFALIDIQPPVVRSGMALEIVVEASEPLTAPPQVAVADIPASLTSENGLIYTFSFALPTPFESGSVDIVCQGEDLSDNPGMTRFPSALTVDNTPPACLDFTVYPAAAAPGDLVNIQFTASKALLGDPIVVVNGNLATLSEDKNESYLYHYTVSDLDAPGPAVIAVSLMDTIGNTAEYLFTTELHLLQATPVFGLAALLTSLATCGVILHRQRRRKGS